MKKCLLIIMLLSSSVMAMAQNVNQKDATARSATADSLSWVEASSETVGLLVQERVQWYQDSIEQQTLRLQIENTKEIGKRKALEAELSRKKNADSLRNAKIKQQIELTKLNARGYPVVLGLDTLCLIYTNSGTFGAADRAEIYAEKLREVSSVFVPSIDSLTIFQDETTTEILFGTTILMNINQADAMWHDKDQLTLAHDYAQRMTGSIVKYREMTSLTTILKQVALSILTVLLCFFMIRLVNLVFRHKVNRFFIGKMGTWFKGWKIRDYEFMNAKRQVRFVLFAIKSFRLFVSLLLLYIVLPILFSIFPMTRRLADTLFGWIWEPVKMIFSNVVAYLPDLFMLIVIWIAMRYVVRGLKFMMTEIENERLKITGFYPDWAKATYTLARLVVYAFTFVIMFQYLPYSESDVFKGVSVFVGLLVSLGSSSAIANLVAGVVITYMRPFRVGDHIKIGDNTGDVLEKTPFVTRIKTHKEEVVTIPNSNILSSTVVNYSTSAAVSGVIFHTTITIGYDVPWRLVHQMMLEAASRCEYVIADPAPFVLQTSLDDFYVSYQLCAYTRNPERQASIYSSMHRNIQDVFNEHGVEILSPHYRNQRDGNETSIPTSYRPEGYTAPRFNINTENNS